MSNGSFQGTVAIAPAPEAERWGIGVDMGFYLSAKSIPEYQQLEKEERDLVTRKTASKALKHWQTRISFLLWALIGIAAIRLNPGGWSGVLIVAVVVYLTGFLFCFPYFYYMRRYMIEYLDSKHGKYNRL